MDQIDESHVLLSLKLTSDFNGHLSLSLFRSIRHIDSIWSEISPERLFFSLEFLSLVEDHPPYGVDQFYVVFHSGNQPVGGAVIQIKRINLNESMNFEEMPEHNKAWLEISRFFKSRISKLLELDTLICGNLLLTGEYGFFFNKSLTYKKQFEIIEESLDLLSSGMKTLNYNIAPILLKDFYRDKTFENLQIVDSEFTEFSVQPNMVMKLNPKWESFGDYMDNLKSKYRVRLKRALKKAAGILKRELDLNEVGRLNKIMYRLYLDTAQLAGFNLFILPEDYFVQLKTYLKEKVKIVGYFFEEQLVGYYTIVYDKEFMEAHYLGFDKEENSRQQIYLNMLFDLVREGIEAKAPKIQFARTALEIKSSVGAKPEEMFCYLKAKNRLLNTVLPQILNWFVPEEVWVERNPFKMQ